MTIEEEIALNEGLMDHGCAITAGWMMFLALNSFALRSQEHKDEQRRAFFMGAQHTFALMILLSELPDTTARLEGISKELDEFVTAEMKRHPQKT